MADLDPSHHFFRHVKANWIDGEFVDPAAFRLREENGRLEDGLSINWYEYFERRTAEEAVTPLREILERKGRTIGGRSRFALLNVGAALNAAAEYTAVRITTDAEEQDPSHALVTGYEAYNEQVAEKLAKIVMATYSART